MDNKQQQHSDDIAILGHDCVAHTWAAQALITILDRVQLTDTQRKAVGYVLGVMASANNLNVADYRYNPAEDVTTLRELRRAGLANAILDEQTGGWAYIPTEALATALKITR